MAKKVNKTRAGEGDRFRHTNRRDLEPIAVRLLAGFDAPIRKINRICFYLLTQVFKRGSVSRELRARSSAVANVHRKFALYRFPFEPLLHNQKEKGTATQYLFLFGADYGARTRHLNLGKVALYQMS